MYDVLLVCLCGFKVSADFRQSDLGERVGLRKRSETRATAWRWLHGHQPGSPTRRDTARIARARLTVPSEELRLIYRRPRLGTASSGPSNLQPREPREERQSAETAFFFPLCSYRRPHTTSFFFFIYFGFFLAELEVRGAPLVIRPAWSRAPRPFTPIFLRIVSTIFDFDGSCTPWRHGNAERSRTLVVCRLLVCSVGLRSLTG